MPVDLISQLEARVADSTFKQINAIAVLKNGEAVLERYFNGTTPDQLHNPKSVGKTFAAAMVGIALRDGHLNSVDQALSEFYTLEDFDNFDTRKGEISIKQLLTMTSGFEGFEFDCRLAFGRAAKGEQVVALNQLQTSFG